MAHDPDNEENAVHNHLWQLAKAVRDDCYKTAVAAYKDARINGLCDEGAWECAVGAMRSIDCKSVITRAITEK